MILAGTHGAFVQTAAQQRVDEICLVADALRIPLHATVELTYRCNIDCAFCYCQHLSNTEGKLELSAEEWKRVLDELAELGVFNLTLTGGEIFVRKDFWEISRHAKSLHFSMTLFTNGTMVDEERADRLAELRPTSIEMSLLGATEETHDRFTRMKGAWKRMMRGAELLKVRNLPFVFKTTLMEANIRERCELERTAKAHGCRAYKNGIEISPCNDGNGAPLKYQVGQRAMFDFYIDDANGALVLPEEQPARGLSWQKSACGAGVNGCAVNPFGDFLPCIQLMLPFGNVREHSLRKMWEDPPGEIVRIRSTKTYGQISACSHCDVIDYCTRCHGLAHLEAGSWDSCYTQARRTAEVVRAVVNFKREGALPNFQDDRQYIEDDAHALEQMHGAAI